MIVITLKHVGAILMHLFDTKIHVIHFIKHGPGRIHPQGFLALPIIHLMQIRIVTVTGTLDPSTISVFIDFAGGTRNSLTEIVRLSHFLRAHNSLPHRYFLNIPTYTR